MNPRIARLNIFSVMNGKFSFKSLSKKYIPSASTATTITRSNGPAGQRRAGNGCTPFTSSTNQSIASVAVCKSDCRFRNGPNTMREIIRSLTVSRSKHHTKLTRIDSAPNWIKSRRICEKRTRRSWSRMRRTRAAFPSLISSRRQSITRRLNHNWATRIFLYVKISAASALPVGTGSGR